MAESIDFSGTELPITVRVGSNVLLRLTDWRDESGALIDFTGGTFDGTVSRRGETVTASQALVFTVNGPGSVTVTLPDTSAWDAGTFFVAKPTYNYIIWYTDSAAVPVRAPQFYGPISVKAGAPE